MSRHNRERRNRSGAAALGKRPSERNNRPRPDAPEQPDPNDVRFIATHEAGHAVSAVLLGFDLKAVDIKRRRLPDGATSLGFTDSGALMARDIAGKGEDAARRWVIQSLTGPFAESCVNPVIMDCDGHKLDAEQARSIAAVAICKATDTGGGRMEIPPAEIRRNDARIQALLESSSEAAWEIVNARWPAIEIVARLLVERKSLTGAEVAEIVNASSQAVA